MKTAQLNIGSSIAYNISEDGIIWTESGKRIIAISIMEDGEEVNISWINRGGRHQFIYTDSLIATAFHNGDPVPFNKTVSKGKKRRTAWVYDPETLILSSYADFKLKDLSISDVSLNKVGCGRIKGKKVFVTTMSCNSSDTLTPSL